jgi:signal transduction histidine kinase
MTRHIHKINLYRIIQEAILNIHKYSDASKVDVKIELLEKHIQKLSIIDDSVGFDVSTLKKGMGLTNIAERTKSLNGRFEIKSKIGEGTELIVLFTI